MAPADPSWQAGKDPVTALPEFNLYDVCRDAQEELLYCRT